MQVVNDIKKETCYAGASGWNFKHNFMFCFCFSWCETGRIKFKSLCFWQELNRDEALKDAFE